MMLYELSFGKIIVLDDHIAEVIINEGVDMSGELVQEFHDLLAQTFPSYFSLIINKINSYSYDFEAQQKLGSLSKLKAIAVIAYSRRTQISTEAIASIPKEIGWNMKMFTNRNAAMEWVMTENEQADSHVK